jgi:cell division protease FtsH
MFYNKPLNIIKANKLRFRAIPESSYPISIPTPSEYVVKKETSNKMINTVNAPPLKDENQNEKLVNKREWYYTDFIDALNNKEIDEVVIKKDLSSLMASSKFNTQGFVELPDDSGIMDYLIGGNVRVTVKGVDQNAAFIKGLIETVITIMFMSGMFVLFSQIIRGGGANGMNSFMQSKAKLQDGQITNIKFNDIAGCEEAKQEVMEIVDFLKSPEKYVSLGANIPKGCLLVGSPGTGKTLLAKAIAGEANVPFFSCSASEFIELFVGVGASRVRDLFTKAKEKAPCIIFIDEIDAIGKSRNSNGMFPGNDEREQTINQLLTEMDGFNGDTGVIIIAATNRPEILDQALLRPGRFDRRVTVGLPDLKGRTDILKIHCKNKPLDESIDIVDISKITAGFTGADLSNLCNEAAIDAARNNKTTISLKNFEHALEKIILGPERKNVLMTDEKKRIVAYHEAGHALISLKIGSEEKLRKVTIVPRGRAAGVTYFEPSLENVDSGLYSRKYLENKILVALGGRVSEEIVFGHYNMTTGASGDFQSATDIARKMVMEFGFSEVIGPSAWINPSLISTDVQNKIDSEVIEILKKSYTRTINFLRNNENQLHKLANALLEKETLSGEEVEALLNA